MKYFKIITVSIFCILTVSNANAMCDLKFEIGDDASIIKKFKEENSKTLKFYGSPKGVGLLADQICSGQDLEGIFIEYMLLNNKIASITLKAKNDKNNSVSNKLGLYNYVKANYGNFNKSGNNPNSWNNFHYWIDDTSIAIYKRMRNGLGIIEEELYLTNPEYQEKITKFNLKKEVEIDQLRKKLQKQ